MATKHPCAGMTKGQIAAFERIAVNQPANCTWRTINILIDAGAIKRGEGTKHRDAMGVYEVPYFYVPVGVHIRWCEWCHEQELKRRKRGVQNRR